MRWFLSINNIELKKSFFLMKGFTLIELLIVITIIGVFASLIIASLSSARVKSIMAANKKEAQQLALVFAKEFADNGSYSNLIRNAWIPVSNTCDNIAVYGNYAVEYRKICNSIMNRLGNGSTVNNWLVGDGKAPSDGQEFSIMIKISPAATTGGQWFCIGSSGRVYNGNYTSSGAGCYYNP
ncbi:MAG: type II secretion system protein [Candidatus Paceibacterota bacterium]|jgi:prepilin-type N-terminal cleavage/methylation domain-containing protein